MTSIKGESPISEFIRMHDEELAIHNTCKAIGKEMLATGDSMTLGEIMIHAITLIENGISFNDDAFDISEIPLIIPC